MNKTTQKILFALPIVVGVYLIVRQFTKKPKQPIPAPEPGVVTGTTSGGSSDSYPLGVGSRGANVTRLQKAILAVNSGLLPRYGADGIFGSETKAALQSLLGKTTATEADVISLESRSRSGSTTWHPPMVAPSGTGTTTGLPTGLYGISF